MFGLAWRGRALGCFFRLPCHAGSSTPMALPVEVKHSSTLDAIKGVKASREGRGKGAYLWRRGGGTTAVSVLMFSYVRTSRKDPLFFTTCCV